MIDVAWPSCEVPPIPPARGYESNAESTIHPRYEDVAQDGRIQLAPLTPGLGAVWRAMGRAEQLAVFREQGILPILRRMVIRGEDRSCSVHAPIRVTGTWRLARERDGDRLFMNMWVEASAPIATTLGPPPPKDAERVILGRVYAEHVITKPFAPAAERKVTRLDSPGLPSLPEDVIPFEDAADLVAGHALASAGEQVFGMIHSDSNQHVNSLVYPRVFEETLVRNLACRADIPKAERLLARAIEIRWRKPFFVGDRAAIDLAVGPIPGGAAAVGRFRPPSAEATKPSCTVAAFLR